MARLYRTSDRIPFKLGSDLTVTISPLSFAQKTELQSMMLEAMKDPMRAVKGANLAIKMAVKKVEGIETIDGKPWEPTFDEQGNLSDESVSDLMNLEENPKLIALCTQLVASVPVDGVIDPSTKKRMDGVTCMLEPQGKKPKARSK